MEAGVWVDGHVDWALAHEELERLAKERGELDGREGLALLRALRAEVHRHLGYASFAQYAERLFGYSFRTIDAKLRTAVVLERVPELRAALCDGVLPWSSVRELARVVTRDTVHEWLEAARGNGQRAGRTSPTTSSRCAPATMPRCARGSFRSKAALRRRFDSCALTEGATPSRPRRAR